MTVTTAPPGVDPQATPADAPVEGATRTRRWMIGAAGAAVAGGAMVVAGAGPAEASHGKVKRVTKYVAVSYRYDARTHKTTVTKARKRHVKAKFVGHKVYEASKGKWVRVPYVWSKKQKALVYSHYLYLQLTAKPPTKPKPTTPAVNPSAPSTGPVAAKATARSGYVTDSMAWHLARRATYGPNPTLLAEIGTTQASMTAWLDKQLAPSTIPDTVCDGVLAALPASINKPVYDMYYDIQNGVINGGTAQYAVQWAHTARALWSKRHLLTVMEDFWGNHFNVPIYQESTQYHRADYQNQIRARALGKFTDLLLMVTKHPAMLTSLGNRYSNKLHPNENQGRELLELHTLGVGNYTETDVFNSTCILTGLTVNPGNETYAYDPGIHWHYGPLKVLGFSAANGSDNGEAIVTSFVSYLAHHPATAKRIATKLVQRFVCDDPTTVPTLVTRLANVYLYCDTAIAPVLRTLFTSAEFAAHAGEKIHRPYERLIASARILDYQPDAVVKDTNGVITQGPGQYSGWNGSLVQIVWDAGNSANAPFSYATPDGFPDYADAWLSTAATLYSWNSRRAICGGWAYGGKMRVRQSDATWSSAKSTPPSAVGTLWATGAAVYPPNSTSGGINNAGPLSVLNQAITLGSTTKNDDVVRALGKRLFGLTLPQADVTALLTFVGVPAGSLVNDQQAATRWYVNELISMLLDSPYGLQR